MMTLPEIAGANFEVGGCRRERKPTYRGHQAAAGYHGILPR